MIVYHPAYDINHCAFRFILILNDVENKQLVFEALEIIDFFFVFPHLISEIKIPRNKILNKNTLSELPKPYENLNSTKRLMFNLKNLHKEVIYSLIAKGIIDKDLYLNRLISLDFDKVPEIIKEEIYNCEERKTLWYKFLIDILSKYPVDGIDGLKHRTNLMEYRYDT